MNAPTFESLRSALAEIRSKLGTLAMCQVDSKAWPAVYRSYTIAGQALEGEPFEAARAAEIEKLKAELSETRRQLADLGSITVLYEGLRASSFEILAMLKGTKPPPSPDDPRPLYAAVGARMSELAAFKEKP